MSSSINVYAVSVQRLEQVVGSGDTALIDAVVEGAEGFLASIDDIDDEAEMTCAEAVAGLINGEVSEDAPGYLYGYALEAICAHEGAALEDIGGISGASDWIEEVDGVLEAKGIPVRLTQLVYGGSPVPIPEPDDYPFIGRWSAEAVAEGVKAMASADLSGLEAEMAEAVKTIRGWVEEAAKIPGAEIVGFLS